LSLAGRLSDPNLDPDQLAMLVRIHFNKKAWAWMPTTDEIRELYFEKYRKAGQTLEDKIRELVIDLDMEPEPEAAE